MSRARPAGKRPRKLWHLAALVLAAALALGAVRAIARDLGELSKAAKIVLIEASIIAGACVVLSVGWLRITRASSWMDRRRPRWPTVRLRLWGVRRGGVGGFLAWVVGGVLELILIAAVVLFATVALPFLITPFARWVVR